MNHNQKTTQNTKQPLAYKSMPQIIWTGFTLLMTLILGYAVIEYYRFDFQQMPNQIIFISVAAIIIGIALLIFLVFLITNPKVLVYQDDQGIYVQKRKKEVFIPFDRIEKVHATISIWAKPFLVYTSLVITLAERSVTIRNIHDMADIRDQIRHKAFKTDD